MISSDLRNLIGSMKAHVDADMMSKGFFEVFALKLHALADEVAQLEAAQVPPHLRRPQRKSAAQLELVIGGRK